MLSLPLHARHRIGLCTMVLEEAWGNRSGRESNSKWVLIEESRPHVQPARGAATLDARRIDLAADSVGQRLLVFLKCRLDGRELANLASGVNGQPLVGLAAEEDIADLEGLVVILLAALPSQSFFTTSPVY